MGGIANMLHTQLCHLSVILVSTQRLLFSDEPPQLPHPDVNPKAALQ